MQLKGFLFAAAFAVSAAVAHAQATTDADAPLQTAHSGTILSTGLEDPRYLLSFPPVQRLVLAATRNGRVSLEQVREALKGLPFDIGNLEAAGVLKPSESGYKIAYTVFTSDDLKRIYAASAGYGASLADAFIAAAPRFERIFQRYPYRQLRSDLAFVTVAGYILNWDGLRIGTELGMRAEPTVRPNGDRYILWSKEKGAGPSVQKAQACHYVIAESGFEIERRTTSDIEELLYRIFSSVTFSMACDWELLHRRQGEDFRRQLFAKQEELLGELSPDRALRVAEYRRILEATPVQE